MASPKPTQSNAARVAAGRRRLHVWISEQSMARLDEICADSGYNRGEQVEAMIDLDWTEWQATKSRAKGRKAAGE